VLVAEDCAATLAALVLILERAGAEVGPCDNPLAAAEAIEEDPTAWDLLVTDLEMPGLDGASLAARARAAAPSMPILLCTGAPGSTIDAVREGFDGVLRKPVAPEVLIAAAQRALIGRSEGDH
jgi:CheY-like chemotaxis protein